MTHEEELAQVLYPNSRTFCGGVAQIARDAFVNGYRANVPTWENATCVKDFGVQLLIWTFYGTYRIGTCVEPGDKYIIISSIKEKK